MTKHLVFFSGGAGSYAATKRVLESGVNRKDLHLLFTDTQIEDIELYRFMMDALEKIYEVDLSKAKHLVSALVGTEVDLKLRKRQLLKIQSYVNRKVHNLHWIRYEINGEGLTPWDIFENDLFIGNSRVANCSTVIKQKLAREYVSLNFEADNTIVYLGIDWSEKHRTSAPTINWKGHCKAVKFPMCEEPLLFKDNIVNLILEDGIEIPKPYLEGQAHLNCGSFCVRGGQGHFAKMLELSPELYEFHAEKERNLRKKIQVRNGDDKNYSILKQTRNGETYSLSLDQLREQLSSGSDLVDKNEFGGCGCFVTEEDGYDSKWASSNLRIVKFEEDSNPIRYRKVPLF